MHAAAIVNDSDLDPTAKVFLVRFLTHYGRFQREAATVKELAKTFAMTDHAISHSTEALVQIGYLRRHSVMQGNTGRPRRQYHSTALLGARLREATEYWQSPHRHYVNDLLLSAVNDERLHQLSHSSLVVLAVLLCHADPCGTVRSLGLSDLVKRTQMSRDAVKARINSLVKAELIRYSSFGTTNAGLFGALKGTHVLDLWRTPELTTFNINYDEIELMPTIAKALNPPKDPPGLKQPRDSISDESLLDAILCRPFDAIQNAESFRAIADRFSRLKGYRKKEIVQRKLEKYACDLMSRSWDRLNSSKVFVNDSVYDQIHSECIPPTQTAGSTLDIDDTHRDELTAFLYGISWNIACVSKAFTRTEDGNHLSAPSFCALIPPRPDKPGQLVCRR